MSAFLDTPIPRNQLRPLIVAIDLELNQPSNKIIQIGAVIGDLRSGEVVSSFSTFADPGEQLSAEIVKLTSIKQSDVDGAGALLDAYGSLVEWMAPYSELRQREALTWGGGDTTHLFQQLGAPFDQWVFSRRWTDAKTVFSAWRMAQGRPWDGGLARAMTKLGLVFEGRKHHALDDARNTFRIFYRLLGEFKNQ